MTARLKEDLARARARVQAQIKADRDNEVAIAMYRADEKRARQALEASTPRETAYRLLGLGDVVREGA